MPKPIKKRIDTRQRILDEEKIKSIYEHAYEYYKTNKNVVIASVLVVAIVLLALITYSFYLSSAKDNLHKEESKAYRLMYDTHSEPSLTEKERLTKAVDHYKKALEIKQDHVTLLSLGHAYFRLSELDKALKTYDSFIKKYHSSKLVPVAYQMKAKVYQEKGENQQALDELDKLANYKNGTFQDIAFFEEAQLLESDGKKEEAIEKYEELINNYPGSLLVGQAKAKLSSLKPIPKKAEYSKDDEANKEGEPETVKEQLTPIKIIPQESNEKTEEDTAKMKEAVQDSEEPGGPPVKSLKINEPGKKEQIEAESAKEMDADTDAGQQVPEKKEGSSPEMEQQSTDKNDVKGSEETGKDGPTEETQL